MRYGRSRKPNELFQALDRWARAILLIASLTVTRLGIFLLVGR
jgi:hypothetical protein